MFVTTFVSVAPLLELDRGAKNAPPPGCGGRDYPPGPAGLNFNPRQAGGIWTPPQAFRRYFKTAVRSYAVFGTHVYCLYILFAHVKISHAGLVRFAS